MTIACWAVWRNGSMQIVLLRDLGWGTPNGVPNGSWIWGLVCRGKTWANNHKLQRLLFLEEIYVISPHIVLAKAGPVVMLVFKGGRKVQSCRAPGRRGNSYVRKQHNKINHTNEKYNIGNTVNNIVIVLYGKYLSWWALSNAWNCRITVWYAWNKHNIACQPYFN